MGLALAHIEATAARIAKVGERPPFYISLSEGSWRELLWELKRLGFRALETIEKSTLSEDGRSVEITVRTSAGPAIVRRAAMEAKSA